MANKTQVATVGEQQAAVVINNQFIDGLTKQLEEKCKYGLSFPKDYNLSNALMGAYLVLKETKDRNNKPILESCSQISIANSLMNMATLGLSVQKKQGYFIAYSGQCQFQRSYFGNMTIARRYGIYVPEANDLTCIKKAKRRNRTRPVSEILLMMFRSANRDYRKAVKQLEEMKK